jgi:hypothetical protein
MSWPHLPGSVPLRSAGEVFAWAGETFGSRARLVSDGETDEFRSQWSPQLPWLAAHPGLEPAEGGFPGVPHYRLKPGAAPTFSPFGFAEWARDSHAALRRARDTGALPQTAKLLVAMPFAVDALAAYLTPDSFAEVLAAYAQQLRATVRELAATIPHGELAIQWDIPYAVQLWSGMDVSLFGRTPLGRAETFDLLVQHAWWVPAGVELGYHLCFGDGSSSADDTLFEGPSDSAFSEDASALVPLANALAAGVGRRVDFLHLPTYATWLEPRHYAPLTGLALDPQIELSLGVINLRRDADVGVAEAMDRARRRAAAAREAIGPTFGISTSCGMGRYTPEQFAAATALYGELCVSMAP